MAEIISNLSNVILSKNNLITVGSQDPKIVILNIMDFGGENVNLLEYNNLIDDNNVLMSSCNEGNIDLSFTKIYYTIDSFDHDELVKMIKNDKPEVIVALGKYVLENLFNLKETITNKVINIPIFDRIPIIPSYSPRYVFKNPNEKYRLDRCMKMAYSCMEEMIREKKYIESLSDYKEISEKITKFAIKWGNVRSIKDIKG